MDNWNGTNGGIHSGDWWGAETGIYSIWNSPLPMIYTMFQYDTKSPVPDDEIKAIIARYIAKHGKPPQIVEVNKDVKVSLDGVPALCLQCVQKGLVYLGEEQKGDEE